jgi:malonyl-CoA O-methyltransferase
METISLKKVLKRSFDRSALNYDQYGKFNRDIGEILLTKLNGIGHAENVLDIGLGTGSLTRNLISDLSPSYICGLDLAYSMLKQARFNSRDIFSKIFFIQADAEKLPFRDDFFNMVFSNLTYQWINNLKKAFGEVKRVLKKRGCFVFSLFGRGTLAELKSVIRVNLYGENIPIKELPDAGIIKKEMCSAGFNEIEIEEKDEVVYFPSSYAAASYLHHIGSRDVFLDNSRGLGNGVILKKILCSYEKKFKKNNKVPATFKVIFVKAKNR